MAYLIGLKRTIAEETQAGECAIKVGKDPLSFQSFTYLSEQFLRHSDQKECIFGHLFFVLCWNLMCRASNTESICLSHIGWDEDSLCIYFAHQKNDQLGEKPRDPRHIYANPLIPQVCPVLSLGIYLICFPPIDNTIRLFEGSCLLKIIGSKQYERFRQLMLRVASEIDVKDELNNQGIEIEDLGTHSMRKGAATYCSSGSTSCPSSTSVHLRAGWSLPGVQDSYLRYQEAGDR